MRHSSTLRALSPKQSAQLGLIRPQPVISRTVALRAMTTGIVSNSTLLAKCVQALAELEELEDSEGEDEKRKLRIAYLST